MIRRIRSAVLVILALGPIGTMPAWAATPEEGASAAALTWSQAVLAGDVDAQMKLLPPTLYSKPGERDRNRAMRLHEKEMAVINKVKILSFEVLPPAQTLKVDPYTVVVVPYRSVRSSPEGKLQTDAALIAMSEGASDTWWVFDAAGQVARTLKVVIPGYVQGLNLPRIVTRPVAGG